MKPSNKGRIPAPPVSDVAMSIAAIGRTFGNPHREIRKAWQQLGSDGRAVSGLLVDRRNKQDEANDKHRATRAG